MGHVNGAGSAGNAAANLQNVQDANQPAPAVGGQNFQNGVNGTPPMPLNALPDGFMGTDELFDQAAADGFSNSNPLAQATPNQRRGAEAVPPAQTQPVADDADTDAAETPPAAAQPGRQVLGRGAGTATARFLEMPLPSTQETRQEGVDPFAALNDQSDVQDTRPLSTSSLLVQDGSSDAGDSDYEMPELRQESTNPMDRANRQRMRFDTNDPTLAALREDEIDDTSTVGSRESTGSIGPDDRRGVQFGRNDPRLNDLREALADNSNDRITSMDTIASRETDIVEPATPATDNENFDALMGLTYVHGEAARVLPDIGFDTREVQDQRNEDDKVEANRARIAERADGSRSSIFSRISSFFGGIADFFRGLSGKPE